MAGGRVECGVLVSQTPTSASLRAGATTITEFARFLGDFLDRPLVDETGLTGTFDLDLQFSAVRSSLPGEAVPGRLGIGNVDEVQTVFTAIQEQLGVRLDSQRQARFAAPGNGSIRGRTCPRARRKSLVEADNSQVSGCNPAVRLTVFKFQVAMRSCG
jgi:hypothetical protein